ncbi:indole-3-glycerol phosphate synthase-domain-containing protein, partial [Jimgerdemannia flammicorona]
MPNVREVLSNLLNSPAILRKDFIVDIYQVMEAHLHGADTVLPIVAMFTDAQLKELDDFSRFLGMEPLVEINNGWEMKRALAISARVVGVNNRNLHNFDVDMETTRSQEGGIEWHPRRASVAGGLDPENVVEMIGQVERGETDGVKDLGKIREFMRRAGEVVMAGSVNGMKI